MREKMSGADTAWLRMDRPTNLMVITGVLWFGAPMDWSRFADIVAERLVAPYPRFRQRVVEPRAGIGPHEWEDDPAFDLARHLWPVNLPAPGDRSALQAHVAERMVVSLDHRRPLWQFDLIDGYGNGSAVLVRIHHCIADGIALARVLLSLTDEQPDRRPVASDDPSPDAQHGPFARLTAPASLALSSTRGVVEAIWHEGEMLVHPHHAVDLAVAARDTAHTLAKLLLSSPDAETVLSGELGVASRVAWSPPIPLHEVKDIAHARGATVNDMLVAAITGAIRAYLHERDSLVDEVRAVVPFNLRPLDEPLDPHLGNRFGLVLLGLPVGIADRAERLALIKGRMDAIKRSPEGPIAYAFLSAMGTTPAPVESALLDLFTAKGSAVVTNVPGPSRAVRLAGVPVRGVLVWAPCSGSVGMSVSIMSYAGDVTIGVMTDAGLVPDPERLVEGSIAELEAIRTLPPAARG